MQTIVENKFDSIQRELQEKAEKNTKRLREALGLEPERVLFSNTLSFLSSPKFDFFARNEFMTETATALSYRTNSSNAVSVYYNEAMDYLTQYTAPYVNKHHFVPIALPIQPIPIPAPIHIHDSFGIKAPINRRSKKYRHNESAVAREERLRENAENRRHAIAGQNMRRRFQR